MDSNSPNFRLLSKIRTENLDVYRVSIQRLREDVGQEAQIAQDYRGRLIYELLQNADDAMAVERGEIGRIRFILTDDELWVGNSGRPLDEADVRGLCGIGASSKSEQHSKRRASIGHKGMGFKSVLEICDAPEVYSTTTSFRFGPAEALRAVEALVSERRLEAASRAPVLRFPWPVERQPNTWIMMRSEGFRTAFCFPLHSKMGQQKRDHLADALRALPITALLFLKRIGRVEVVIQRQGDRYGFAWTVARERATAQGWCNASTLSDTGLYRVTLISDSRESESFLIAHNGDIEIGDHRGGLDEFTWDGVAYTEVSVATRISDGVPRPLRAEWRKFHVFLPTAEPCPYELLVSGAFSSSLSRQEIRVELDPANYNRFLLHQAALLLRDALIPALLSGGVPLTDVLRLLQRQVTSAGAPSDTLSAQTLYEAVRAALLEHAIVPTADGSAIGLARCAVPPLVDDVSAGRDFRRLLPRVAHFGSLQLPAVEFCGSDIGRILVDHGAHSLDPIECASALASADPDKSTLVEDASGGYFRDPILSVLERLWMGLGAQEREQLSAAVKRQPLFPVGWLSDGSQAKTVSRVVTENHQCFYPPRSLRGEVPLDGLCFLMQEICWGALLPKERNVVLRQEMIAWQALFDVREFKFPDVMRAGVLPALDLDRDEESRAARHRLRTMDRLAAICQLAGRTPNPAAPLPYERLGSNRALFNLSRLDVPCRGKGENDIVWAPAYLAYLGEDWVGDNSIGRVLSVARETGVTLPQRVNFLIGPAKFAGLLQQYGYLRSAAQSAEAEVGADEVGLEEDDESALEADERTRWLNFFLWLGVNQALRPVHFHDVEDRASGWLSTPDLRRPTGWVFQNVPEKTWGAFVRTVLLALQKRDEGRFASSTPYFYQLHDLEHLVTLLNAASCDTSARLARALYEHLARNWEILRRFSRVLVAQIPKGQFPSMRSKPPRASGDEVIEIEDDFWVQRLRTAPFCPTGHGPRLAANVWLPSQEIQRRFARKTRDGSNYLVPTLDVDSALTRGSYRSLAHLIGIREELTPDTFTLDDARLLLERLRDLFADHCAHGDDLQFDLSQTIRPAYRNLIELLSGRGRSIGRGVSLAPLADASVLAHDGRGHYRFAESRTVFYVDRRETRIRLQTDEPILTFVIEASPAARVPAVQVFGMRVLEEQLVWSPRPGDPALTSSDLDRFRAEIRKLAPYVLARIGVDRADENLVRQDVQSLRLLVESLEPVTHLELACYLDERQLSIGTAERDAFVESSDERTLQAFVVWGDNPWPPLEHEAEALAGALCEVFGAGYFESFLALAKAGSDSARERLLKRAGAPSDLSEKRALLEGDTLGRTEIAAEPEEVKTAASAGEREEPARLPDSSEALAKGESEPRPTPLFSPAQILVEGEPVKVLGLAQSKSGSAESPSQDNGKRDRHSASGKTGYGGHTDLFALEEIGMLVALAYEKKRLLRAGLTSVEVFDPTKDELQPAALIFDVSRPERITKARLLCPRFNDVARRLHSAHGISQEWPGYDILTLDPSSELVYDRLIELKSSGVNSRVHEMSWNEWKTAKGSKLRPYYYLYLVGNLRSDLRDGKPFIRTIKNPFEQIASDVRINRQEQRQVMLAVHLFKEAEHLDLEVVRE